MSDIFKRILVGVSGTESSVAAVGLAVRLAQLHGAHLVLVSVVDIGMAQEIARVMQRPEDEVLADMERSNQGYLRQGETMARRVGVSVETVVRRGTPYLEIAAEAEDTRTELVVLGSSHGRGLRRRAIGRVVERVVEYAECPVLIVRHPVSSGQGAGAAEELTE